MNELEPPRITGNDVNAYCPVCNGRSNFVRQSGTFSPGRIPQLNKYFKKLEFGTLTFLILKCITCQLGGFAVLYQQDHQPYVELVDFHPKTSRHLPLPQSTPSDIESEFRSAENCAGINELRPAAAMLRSTIEKVLIKHGYEQKDLYNKLEQLATDRIITRPLAKQNQEIVRILGNDVLHKDWRVITPEEFSSAYKYTHRLIDAFYDDHESVVEELKKLGRKTDSKTNEEQDQPDPTSSG